MSILLEPRFRKVFRAGAARLVLDSMLNLRRTFGINHTTESYA